jgi:UDP-GlcNAc:undecaprenyl-phosphate/decaprenyl-phosphate GlcNAc-1-phosphate transferase
MYSLLFLSALACLLSLALTPLLRGLARRRGWLDCPDGGRKFHTRAVPRVGGVAVACSYLLTFAIWLVLPLNATVLIQGHLALAFRLLPVAALLLAIGLADDLRGLSPRQKLAGQTIAAALACGAGVRVTTLADIPISGPLSVALTLAWLLMCTNAFNLIDGMDGLAAGVGLLASLTMLLAALLQGSVPLALATAPLAGALLGFLRYNRAPASIFLGDSGSLTVGFLLGCYGVLWTQKCATLLGLAAPVMALALPLVEIALSVGRRFLKGEPIFRADRDHIHHRLLRLGFSPRKAVFILYAAASVAAGLSLLQSVGGRGVEGLVLVLFCAFVWVAVQSLGYIEFGAASRLVLHGGLRRALHSEIALEEFRHAVESAVTPGQCWPVLERTSAVFGFASVELRLLGETFQTGAAPAVPSLWLVWIPLGGADYVRLRRSSASSFDSMAAAPFAEAVAAALSRKRESLAVFKVTMRSRTPA